MTNLHRKALHLAYFTIAYNVVECVLALLAGAWAGSIALVGFGLDSLVESLSGGVMIYRFARHATLSPARGSAPGTPGRQDRGLYLLHPGGLRAL